MYNVYHNVTWSPQPVKVKFYSFIFSLTNTSFGLKLGRETSQMQRLKNRTVKFIWII